MFSNTEKEFWQIKHLTEKTTVRLLASLTHVRVVVDHTMPIQLQRSAKLKTSYWFLLICVFCLSIHLLSKAS